MSTSPLPVDDFEALDDMLLDEEGLRKREKLAAIKDELQRRRWLREPESWVSERLEENCWSKQIEILRSVIDNRFTAVPSCFGSGKSWLAARLATFWIDVHPPGTAFVVTTARSGAQVKAILWRELQRAHIAGSLDGRLNKTEWWLDVNGKEEIVAFGRKPDDMDTIAFQGIHARYVLVLIDEAAGINKLLFESLSSLIVNEDSRMLAIGNPEDASSEFAEICKPGSGWNTIQIKAWDTPNFSGEEIEKDVAAELISKMWVEEKRKRWGEGSPMWEAKIEADFPSSQINGVFPISLIRAAQDRKLKGTYPNELGVDVGGGGDPTVVANRRGGVVRIVHQGTTPDTMESTGEVANLLKTMRAEVAKIDEIGIGKGMADRGKELNLPFVGVNVAMKPEDPENYLNLRAEGYWQIRERMEAEKLDIDPDDEDLVAELVSIRYKRTSSGKIQIESKDEMRRRTKGMSPNKADAVVLSFIKVPEDKAAQHGAVW